MKTLNTHKLKRLAILITVFLLTGNGAGIAQDSLWTRKYQLSIYNQNDLRISSNNAITTQRIMLDVFRKGVTSKMNKTWGNVTYGLYSFATTYLTMIWSHEFGHSLRANQVGGQFKIHNVNLPIPYTTMHLPDSINLENTALSVTGGFEVNYLNVRTIQRDFILQNGIYNEDLSFAFANRLMYPLYTTVIVPINPNEKDVWVHTAGDPVHIVLPVFKNYSNNQVFLQDSVVNPDLAKFYGQSAMLATFFNLLDPQFYREVGAAFGKNKIRKPIFLLGNHHTGWTYGTLFSMSPLGYELYLNNYIHVKGNKFSLYLKYGNPYRNRGLGMSWNEIELYRNMNLSVCMDAWDQDIYGRGLSGEVSMDWRFSKYMGMNITAGYKSKGFVLGKQTDAGFNAGLSVVYFANYQ